MAGYKWLQILIFPGYKTDITGFCWIMQRKTSNYNKFPVQDTRLHIFPVKTELTC